MNHRIFLLSVILFVSTNAIDAQFGVHAGLNVSQMRGLAVPEGIKESYQINFNGGLYYEMEIKKYFDVRAGLIYSPKGLKWTIGDEYYILSFNYLEIPVQAKLRYKKVYALGGIYSAYAINGRTKSNSVLEIDEEIEFKTQGYRHLDFGFKGGLGYLFRIFSLDGFVQADYAHGIVNINKNDGDKMKNRLLSLSAGVAIDF